MLQVDVSKCQYIVDWDNRAASVDEPNYSLATTEWKVVASAPFLDAGRLLQRQSHKSCLHSLHIASFFTQIELSVSSVLRARPFRRHHGLWVL